jgi:sugar phosphate permease
MLPTSHTLQAPRTVPRLYYGWTVLVAAAAAMVGTLPGRTQGLGLITEPLLTDLGLSRVTYAELNLWATIVGSAGAIGIGHLVDRFGSRVMLTTVSLLLGLVVCAMSQSTTFAGLAVWITLTRALGQSALSVVSLTIVGQWFVKKIDAAMAVFSIVMSVGFMLAFPTVGALVQQWGWRAAWLTIGCTLVAVLAPVGWAIVRRSPADEGLAPDGYTGLEPSIATDGARELDAQGWEWTAALATPAFWVFAVGTALYGLV